MKILKLESHNEKEVLQEAVRVLKNGGTVVYPTDTSYGLGCDATNIKAVQKVYRIKERGLRKKSMHVLVPSPEWAHKAAMWNKPAKVLAKRFLPGPLSMALPLKSKSSALRAISPDGFLGLRLPKNNFALKLVKKLGRPITATSANPSTLLRGGYDSYSINDVVGQFKNRKSKPDLIIDAGQLKKIKPSTFIRVDGDKIYFLRAGPISEKAIMEALKY